jgi:hypothetical protein
LLGIQLFNHLTRLLDRESFIASNFISFSSLSFAFAPYSSSLCLHFNFCSYVFFVSLLFKRVRVNREKRLVASSCLSLVCPSVRLSACVSAAPTGRILCKFGYWKRLGKYVDKLQIWLKSDKAIVHFSWDLSTFVLLPAVQNILQLDNSANGTHFVIPMAALNSCMLLNGSTTIERERIAAFLW